MTEEQNAPPSQPGHRLPARELIVVAKPGADLRVTREGIASAKGVDTSAIAEVLSSEGAVLRPLFGVSENRLRDEAVQKKAPATTEVPDLAMYYKVEAPDERLDSLAERLRQLDVVEAAYVKPRSFRASTICFPQKRSLQFTPLISLSVKDTSTQRQAVSMRVMHGRDPVVAVPA